MNRLFELRKEKNLTQNAIADFLGVTRQAYSRYELGERELGYPMLVKLSEYFQVDIEYLLGRTDKRGLSPFRQLDIQQGSYYEMEPIILTTLEHELLKYYRVLDDKKKLMLIDFAKKLCDI